MLTPCTHAYRTGDTVLVIFYPASIYTHPILWMPPSADHVRNSHNAVPTPESIQLCSLCVDFAGMDRWYGCLMLEMWKNLFIYLWIASMMWCACIRRTEQPAVRRDVYRWNSVSLFSRCQCYITSCYDQAPNHIACT